MKDIFKPNMKNLHIMVLEFADRGKIQGLHVAVILNSENISIQQWVYSEKFMANITFLLIFFFQKVCKNSEQDTFQASRSTGPSFDYSFKTVEIADASNQNVIIIAHTSTKAFEQLKFSQVSKKGYYSKPTITLWIEGYHIKTEALRLLNFSWDKLK